MTQHIESDTVTARKQQLRADVRSSRRALTTDERTAAGRALAGQLSALVESLGARSVACYLALPSEPDTGPFLTWAAETGIEVLLPKSLEGFRLGWIRQAGAATEEGAHGIREPIGELLPRDAVSQVDLMLIPAAAVDEHGMRLGWGLGYYDRCLASLSRTPPVFAIVHDADLLTEVPAEAHDSPVDGVVTPSGVRRFRTAGEGKL